MKHDVKKWKELHEAANPGGVAPHRTSRRGDLWVSFEALLLSLRRRRHPGAHIQSALRRVKGRG